MSHKTSESPDEQLKRLTTEAHEATKDLRAATREAREAKSDLQRVAQSAQATVLEALATATAAALEHFGEEFQENREVLALMAAAVGDHFARLLGAADRAALTKEIMFQMHDEIQAALDRSMHKAAGEINADPSLMIKELERRLRGQPSRPRRKP